MQWQYLEVPEKDISTLRQSLQISPLLAQLLTQVGIKDTLTAQRFLYPKLAHLEDPFKINNLEAAAKRIYKAIINSEKISIIGDYDADGVTSTALLHGILKELGNEPKSFIPNRKTEGYGLSNALLERVFTAGTPAILVVLDCGTNSHKEIAALIKQGVEVIVLDHHQIKEGIPIPKKALVINPHVFEQENAAPWKDLCAVGLTFKLLHGLIKILRETEHPSGKYLDPKDLLDLVALGTIADLVPILQENRVLAFHGLKRMQHSIRPGIQALCKVSGLQTGQVMKASDVSYRLGPRINASGRMSDASLPVDMLLGEDFQTSLQLANQLNDINQERQNVEKEITLEVEKLFETQKKNISFVAYCADWHSGVVGVVAGKIAQQYNKPAIVLGQEGKLAKGSARSITGVNLMEALAECSKYLESWGGHPMAAGVALEPSQIEPFRKQFESAVKRQLEQKEPEASINIAAFIQLEDLNERLLNELDLLSPFGMGNPEPIFGLKNVYLPAEPTVFATHHIRFYLQKSNGICIQSIGWRKADNPPPAKEPLDLAVKFSYNIWNNRKTPQLELVDWQAHSG